jgi:hypothetical protein
MLCDGERFGFEKEDTSNASNFEIVSAFSLSPTLSVHCIINTAGRELFVAASSCRNAKIIAVYSGHLEAIAYGKCSRREAEELLDRAPPSLRTVLEDVASEGEPRALWGAGYVSDEGKRLLREHLEQMLARNCQ